MIHEMNDHVWRQSLKIGDLLDCLDTDNKWFEGIVIGKLSDGVTVHFRGWSSRYDVFESFLSSRIQQPYTRTIEWRKSIDVGDFIEVKDKFTGVSLWYIGTVVRVDRMHNNISVRYSFDDRFCTFDLEGERVSYLGTHIRKNQHVNLTKEMIRYISERHLEKWKCHCEEESSSFLCCICYINVKNVVLSPCNHLCVCSKCSSNHFLQRCPLCNADIVSKLKVYV